ncbi:MAG: leucine-rich repeat domain-containing protein [Pseudomonadota bacterium]
MVCSRGHVSGLNLSDNQLSGSIPPSLAQLSNLGYLNLNSNQLNSSIHLPNTA